jgi:hypothetical protein
LVQRYKNCIKPKIDELKELDALKPIVEELIQQGEFKKDISFWLNASIVLFTCLKLGMDVRGKIIPENNE